MFELALMVVLMGAVLLFASFFLVALLSDSSNKIAFATTIAYTGFALIFLGVSIGSLFSLTSVSEIVLTIIALVALLLLFDVCEKNKKLVKKRTFWTEHWSDMKCTYIVLIIIIPAPIVYELLIS